MLAYNRRTSSAIRVGGCYYNILQLWILNAYIYIYIHSIIELRKKQAILPAML